MKKILPPSDTRLRSDIRYLESFEIDKASEERDRITNKWAIIR